MPASHASRDPGSMLVQRKSTQRPFRATALLAARLIVTRTSTYDCAGREPYHRAAGRGHERERDSAVLERTSFRSSAVFLPRGRIAVPSIRPREWNISSKRVTCPGRDVWLAALGELRVRRSPGRGAALGCFGRRHRCPETLSGWSGWMGQRGVSSGSNASLAIVAAESGLRDHRGTVSVWTAGPR